MAELIGGTDLAEDSAAVRVDVADAVERHRSPVRFETGANVFVFPMHDAEYVTDWEIVDDKRNVLCLVLTYLLVGARRMAPPHRCGDEVVSVVRDRWSWLATVSEPELDSEG